MITPEDVAAMLVDAGEACTLRRGDPPGNVDVAVRAKVLQLKADELVGDIVQTDRKAIISNVEIVATGWPGPPKRGDRLVVDGKVSTVQLPGTKKVGDVVVGHWMIVRGL